MKRQSKPLTIVFILICAPFIYFLLDNFELSSYHQPDIYQYNYTDATDLFWLDRLQDKIIYTIKEIPFYSNRFTPCNHLAVRYRSFGGSLVKTTAGFVNFQTIFEYPSNCTLFENGVVGQECKHNRSKSLLYVDALDNNFDKTTFVYNGAEYPSIIEIIKYGSYGPRDPKATIDPYGNIILSFSMFDIYDNPNMWIYNCTTSRLESLKPIVTAEQTNWIPYYDDGLRFVYSWEPIKTIAKDAVVLDSTHYSIFKGATPLVKYKRYYIGIIQVDGNCHKIVTRPRLIILNEQMEPIYISEKLVFDGKLFIKPFFNYSSLSEIPGIHHTGLFQVGSLLLLKNDKWVMECSINEQNNIIVQLYGLSLFIDSILDRYKEHVRYHHPLPDLFQRVLDETDNICTRPISTKDKYPIFLSRIKEANKKYKEKHYRSFYKCLGTQNVFENTKRSCYFENLCYDTIEQEFQFYQPSSEPIFYDREQGPIYEFIEPFVDLGASNFTPKVVIGDLDMNNTAISTIRTVLWDHSDSLTIEHLIYEQLVGTFITLERFGARDNDTQLLHLRNSDDPDFIKHTTTFGRAITTRPLKGMHDYIKEIGKENRYVCFKELIVSSPSTVYNEYSDVYKEGREVIWEKFRERLFKTLGIKQIEPLKNVLFIRDTNITNYNETIHYLQSRFNEFNFTLADIDNHSIEEQLELVSKYSIIVGSQLVPFMHQKSCAIIPDTILRNYEDDHVGLKYFWNYFTVRKLYYQMIDDKFDFERIEHLFHTAITELEISTQDGNTLNLADEKRNVH